MDFRQAQAWLASESDRRHEMSWPATTVRGLSVWQGDLSVEHVGWIDLRESRRGRAPVRAGTLAAFGSRSFLDHQLGRLNPCEATLLLDDAAAHTHLFSGVAVLVGAAVEFVRLLDDHHSSVVGVDGQPELFRVLDRS